MNASKLPNWALGKTRRYTHFSRLAGEAQANAASFGAFGEVVVYEGDLVIGKKPGKELYFLHVDGVEHVSDLQSCENALFGRAEFFGILPEKHAPAVLLKLTTNLSVTTTAKTEPVSRI
jgi:hypothetical protein